MRIYLLSALILTFSSLCYGQIPSVSPKPLPSASPEKPRTKIFGSSLKKREKQKNDGSKETENSDKSEKDEIIKIKTDLVVSDVLVVNQKGNVILGLKQNDFVITEDGTPQEIGMFSFGENATIPRSIVLIIDNSIHLLPYIKNSVDAAKLLVDKLGTLDKMAIVNSDVKLLVGFTKDKTLLKKTLDSIEEKTLARKTDWQPRPLSSLLAVLNEMFDDEDIRPIIILQADGGETGWLKVDEDAVPYPPKARAFYLQMYGESKFGFSDINKAIEKSRATIYSIIPGIRFLGFSKEEQMARAATHLDIRSRQVLQKIGDKRVSDYVKKFKNDELEESIAVQTEMFNIAQLSGGYMNYIEKPEDAENVYSTLFTVINNRYVIGYYPSNLKQDGKRHIVKIEVKGHPEYIITGRKFFSEPTPVK